MDVILNEVKNLSYYFEERCFAIAQHDSVVSFAILRGAILDFFGMAV